jgi:hypothetical protein
MTSLSGSDLKKATRTASGRGVEFVDSDSGFRMISKEGVELLVKAEPDRNKKARLGQPKFKAVLRECAGVPRLLEKVFLTAGSSRINDDSSCEAIRAEVGRLFETHDKYDNRQLRNDALLAALSGTWRQASDDRLQKTLEAEREGYLFDGTIPPLLLMWWSDMRDEPAKSDEMHALLQAAVGIYTLSDDVGGAMHGPRFEKQLAHLWRILTITDAVWRRDEASESRPRTIHGMLGGGQVAVANNAVACHEPDAAFNVELRELRPAVLLERFQELDKPAADPTDVPATPKLGTPYFPKDQQNPGFDFAIFERTVDGGVQLVLVETKFSAQGATTAPLSKKDIVDKYVKAIEGRPEVRARLLQGQLCYVIGGLREVQNGAIDDVDGVVEAIVEALQQKDVVRDPSLQQLVGGSLVLLTRGHTELLLTPTLSSLPPFIKQW